MMPELAINSKKIQCKLHYKKISADVKLDSLSQVFSELKSPSILGSNNAQLNSQGFSYWSAEPIEIFEFNTSQKKPFEKLQNVLNKYKLENSENELPKGMFLGGWIGYFAYELGRYIEKIPETTIDNYNMPLIRICFYDKLIAYDHSRNQFWLICLGLSNDGQEPKAKFEWLENNLTKVESTIVQRSDLCDLENINPNEFKCNMTKIDYVKAVEKIRQYIYDGIVYQVNFSQRFDYEYNGDPIKLFQWQNQHNPSGYAAYIAANDFSIVSASPEMFISIKDGWVSTKPIKGTRKRLQEVCSANIETNKNNYNELLACEKEKAELNMIIDLERNDLVRVCKYGTRKVTQSRTIEAYPTVYHAVATVSGQIREDVGLCDCLKAMFPGGSITGAPKVSSMNIIDETEPSSRSVYTGSIGYIGIDGTVCLNIAIRTIIITQGKAFVQTGGGIVADSDPLAEWDETMTKARALLAGIKATENL